MSVFEFYSREVIRIGDSKMDVFRIIQIILRILSYLLYDFYVFSSERDYFFHTNFNSYFREILLEIGMLYSVWDCVLLEMFSNVE